MTIFIVADGDTSMRQKKERSPLADAGRDRPNRVIVRRIELREV